MSGWAGGEDVGGLLFVGFEGERLRGAVGARGLKGEACRAGGAEGSNVRPGRVLARVGSSLGR